MTDTTSVFGLTSKDISTIDDIISKVFPVKENANTGKKAGIVDALQRWSWLVNDIEGVYELTRWDYVNDLRYRNFLKEVLEACPPDIKLKLSDIVGGLDARYYRSTEMLDYPLSGSKGMFSMEEFPWYYRIPIRRSKDFVVN